MQCNTSPNSFDASYISKAEDILYKNAFDNAMDIIMLISEDGRLLHANKKAIEVYGYTYNELLTLSIFDLRKQDIREFTEKQLNEALERGIHFQTFHFKKDGTRFPVEVRSVKSGGESENNVVSIIRDITEKTNKANLEERASFFSNICEDIFITLSNDMNIISWSIEAEEKFGYKSEEIIGENIKILVPEDKRSKCDENLKRVKRGEIIKNYETIRVSKDGAYINVSISISQVYDFDGTAIGVIGIYKDISEKKLLLNKIEEHEERWRFALEGGELGVFDWNIRTNQVFYSKLWKEMLGYNEDEISNSLEEWNSRIHPDDLLDVLDKINVNLNGEVFILEYKLKCKNDNYKWIRTRGKVLSFTNDGKPQRIIATNEDITKRKLMEQEIKKKYTQLGVLKGEAESANNAKSMFIASVSHEIRTPMNSILGILQILQTTRLDEEQSKFIRLLKESANNLLTIMNDLLDISKVKSGMFKLNNIEFNPHETINSIYTNLLVTGNLKGLEISFYSDPSINHRIIGDELRLKQILNNLINNAVKFTDEGYISLRVTKISSSKSSEKIEFRIKDTGIGIEEDFNDKIFKNFHQGELSLEKKNMGTGLGLSISKQLAVLMNGDITFESVANKGTVFIFTCEFQVVNN